MIHINNNIKLYLGNSNELIKDIQIDERPRERLVNYGSSALSNEELLAILLKTGTRHTSVKSLARQLLNIIDDISGLKDITINK